MEGTEDRETQMQVVPAPPQQQMAGEGQPDEQLREHQEQAQEPRKEADPKAGSSRQEGPGSSQGGFDALITSFSALGDTLRKTLEVRSSSPLTTIHNTDQYACVHPVATVGAECEVYGSEIEIVPPWRASSLLLHSLS